MKSFKKKSILASNNSRNSQSGDATKQLQKEREALKREKKESARKERAEKKAQQNAIQKSKRIKEQRLLKMASEARKEFVENANTRNIPKALNNGNIKKKRQVKDLTQLKRNVTSSNLAWIDFKFDNKKDMADLDIDNVKGTLIIGFKQSGVYEYYNVPFIEYQKLFGGGKEGFWHHNGEAHTFSSKSVGHYFYYHIKDKYQYKKLS